MNKGGIIGIIAIIIAIIAGASYFSSTSESNEGISIIEDLALEDLETEEEIIPEEPETAGKEFSVEFSEKIGLETP